MSTRVLHAREEVGDVVCELGEGPVWDVRVDRLRWVDLLRGLIHSYSPSDGRSTLLEVGQPVGFIVPVGVGQLLAGLRDGFALIASDGTTTLECELERDRPYMRMNDGKADSAGRVWAGTMGSTELRHDGTLYRLNCDWSVDPQLRQLTIPNGIGWSPDGATMYFTDSHWNRIDAFSYDTATGEITDQRVFVDIPADLGAPDGFTIDEDGCVWVALWQGAAVHRYTPHGRLDTIIRVPAYLTTSCVFGGSDRRALFITSANAFLTERQQSEYPRSGRVFTSTPAPTGLPGNAFVPAPAENSVSQERIS